MELRPFKELVGMSKEKLDEALAPIRERQVKSKAELKMSELEADIIRKETQVQELCIENDIDLEKLLNLLDEVALLERRIKQYQVVLEQLFPEEKKKK